MNCSARLCLTQVMQIVNSTSPDIKKFWPTDAVGLGSLTGDIEFIWDIFYCPSCDEAFPIHEVRNQEREQKRLMKQSRRKHSILRKVGTENE